MPGRTKILVVDDNVDVTTTIKIGLETFGFDIYVYNEPAQAYYDYKAGFYDLILTDIRMPKMTGFELCEKIRMVDSDVKICFLTSFEAYYESLLEKYDKIDCKCFIRKPIQMADLVKRIEKELSLDAL